MKVENKNFNVKYIRSYTLSLVEELKIIKITCDEENNCTGPKNFFASPPADNLILLGEKKNTEDAKEEGNSKLSKFLNRRRGQRRKKRLPKPEEIPTHKKIVLIRREISIEAQINFEVKYLFADMRACQIVDAVQIPQTDTGAITLNRCKTFVFFLMAA